MREFLCVFPVGDHSNSEPHCGMMLRDLFAGMALAGRCANDATALLPEEHAVEAYAIADAMLAQRTVADE